MSAKRTGRKQPAIPDAKFRAAWARGHTVQDVADALGVSRNYVYCRANVLRKAGTPVAHKRRGYQARSQEAQRQHLRDRIPAAAFKLLGEVSDAQVAERAGVSRERVRQWRAALGIPSARWKRLQKQEK